MATDASSFPAAVRELFPIGDARLLGIRWLENGRDVAIDLELPLGQGQPGRRVTLMCEGATELSVQLEFGNLAGALLWEGDVSHPPGGGFSLLLDFGGSPEGAIRLRCSNLSIAAGPPNATA